MGHPLTRTHQPGLQWQDQSFPNAGVVADGGTGMGRVELSPYSSPASALLRQQDQRAQRPVRKPSNYPWLHHHLAWTPWANELPLPGPQLSHLYNGDREASNSIRHLSAQIPRGRESRRSLGKPSVKACLEGNSVILSSCAVLFLLERTVTLPSSPPAFPSTSGRCPGEDTHTRCRE